MSSPVAILPEEALEIARRAFLDSSLDPEEKVNIAELAISHAPQANAPIYDHICKGGLYVREIVMPAGFLCSSVRHLYEHPFIVLKGLVSVFWTDFEGMEHRATFQGPTYSITKPGTRRILYCHEETTWITVHRTDKEDRDAIMEEISDSEANPLLMKEFLAGWKRANERAALREAA